MARDGAHVIVVGNEKGGSGKSTTAFHLAIYLLHAGHRVAFAPATGWITRLAEAHRIDRLDAELRKISRYGLIVIDEVGYIPFDTEAANLFFQLVSSRYERASLIVPSDKNSGPPGARSSATTPSPPP